MQPTVLVEATETWPAVIAGLISGLGAAGIVSYVTLRAAKKQRANDVALAKLQREADADRTDKQLAHDRDMRNLQFLRETLAPIVSRALDWDAFISLHRGVATTGDKPFDEWKDAIAPLAQKVSETNEALRRDARTLIILLGVNAQVAIRLNQVGDDGDALIKLTRKRAEASEITAELGNELTALLAKYGDSHSRFIEAANNAAGIGP